MARSRPSSSRWRASWALAAVTITLVLAACGAPGPSDGGSAAEPTSPTVPPPESIDAGPAAPEAGEAARALASRPMAPPASAVDVLVDVADVRFAWDLVERLRFEAAPEDADRLADGLAELTGVDRPAGTDAWAYYTDLLLAWDVEAPPGYVERKRALHAAHDDPAADAFFDAAAPIDWRRVTASGSGRDGVVPLDDPAAVAADSVDWLGDDEPIFVVAVGDERRAYPRRVLRAHEIVNDTLGQQRILVSWCEVCSAAVAWRSASAAGGSLQLASSGLLLDGAPLAYDRATRSLVDTFRGEPLTGALVAAGPLHPIVVVTTTWGAWANDATAAPAARSVVAEDGGIGRVYLDEQTEPATGAPAGWPVGQRDERLDGGERVLGVHLPDGGYVAFPVDAARRVLDDGRAVRWAGVEVAVDGGGLVARRPGSDRLVAGHEASWRSWSRFHADSLLWSPGS